MATRGKVAGAALALALAAMGASGMEARAEGFGSASSGVLYNPKRGVELENLLKLDEKARNRKASVLTRGNIDVLLQELNALQAVNEEALEQVDAELALLAAKNLEGQLSEYSETDAYANLSDQKKRLVDKRSNEASLQRRLKERKVIFGRLAAQGPVVVYGAAFVASIVSNATMHPLDTIKVRKISLRQKKSKEVGASVDLSVDESADEIRGYEPTWDEIVGEDGAMSLYDGLSSNLIKEGVPLALYLGLYEYAKDLLLQVDVMRPHPILIYLIAGGFGEFFASILRLPGRGGEEWYANRDEHSRGARDQRFIPSGEKESVQVLESRASARHSLRRHSARRVRVLEAAARRREHSSARSGRPSHRSSLRCVRWDVWGLFHDPS